MQSQGHRCNMGDELSDVINLIHGKIDALDKIIGDVQKSREYEIAYRQLKIWRLNTSALIAQFIGQDEGVRLNDTSLKTYSIADPISELVNTADLYRDYLLELTEQLQDGALEITVEPFDDVKAMAVSAETSQLNLFISHSSEESELAELIVELLKMALNLPSKTIRCTSVDGYRLSGGVDSVAQLREEVVATKALVGIISSTSISSLWVVFELGARWGIDKYLLPLMAPGASTDLLSGPLATRHALRSDERGQLLQLVGDIADELGIESEESTVYDKYISKILEYAEEYTPTDTGQIEERTQSQEEVELSLLRTRIDILTDQIPGISGLHLNHPDSGQLRRAARRYLRELDDALPGDNYVKQFDDIAWHPPDRPADDSDRQRRLYVTACDNLVALLRDASKKISEKLDAG